MKQKITRRNAIIGTTAAVALTTMLSQDKTPNPLNSPSQDNLSQLPKPILEKPSTPTSIQKETPLAKIVETLEELPKKMMVSSTPVIENDEEVEPVERRVLVKIEDEEVEPVERRVLVKIEKTLPLKQKSNIVFDEASKTILTNSLPKSPTEVDSSQKIQNLFEKISKDELVKRINDPNAYYPGDILASKNQMKLIKSCYLKLDILKRTIIGVGNFNITDFQRLQKVAQRWNKKYVSYRGKKIKFYKFTDDEMNFMISVFNFEPNQYGIFGNKTIDEFDRKIDKKALYRPSRAINPQRHYIFEGRPRELFTEIIQKADKYNKTSKRKLEVVLTSGVRGIPKQLTLFLNKCLRTKGNFSAACRSILFPGYSYHHLSDFDIGKKGNGYGNFNKSFKKTKEYKFLANEGILTLRYPEIKNVDDLKDYDGVIYGLGTEYWHVYVDNEVRDQHASIQNLLPTLFDLSQDKVVNPHAQHLFQEFAKITKSEFIHNPAALAQLIQGIALVEGDLDDNALDDDQNITRRSIFSSLLNHQHLLYS